jgi:mannose-1-phosphate guanylyltransferase
MLAIILVGGEGTRLRPLTYRTPKSMVPVLGRPFIGYVLEHLARHGITNVVLAMSRSALAGQIEAYVLGRSAVSPAVAFSWEDEPLGSGGAIKLAERYVGETFVVLNGDIYTDLDLTAMLAEHRRNGATVSISLTSVEDPSAFGVVDLEDHGQITRFVEKPPREEAPSNWINAGTWIFEPRALAHIPPGMHTMVERELFPQLIERGEPVFGYRSDAYWVDIGTPERYLGLNLDLARRGLAEAAGLRLLDRPGGGLWHGEEARISDGAEIRGVSVAGRSCVIGRGATVEGSLLWDGVTIEDGAGVAGSILADGAGAGAGSRLSNAVIAHTARVATGATPEDGLRLEPGDEWPQAAGHEDAGASSDRSFA